LQYWNWTYSFQNAFSMNSQLCGRHPLPVITRS
jgi:hypothetical protein